MGDRFWPLPSSHLYDFRGVLPGLTELPHTMDHTRMNAYLMHGPQNGQFVQVNSVWPPKALYFPVPDEGGKVAEYFLDSILPLPRPLRGRIATYRYRITKESHEQTKS